MANNDTLIKLTSLEVGESITGTITGVETGKYGPVLVMTIDGKTAKVFPAGNIKKFFQEDQNKGLYNIGKSLTITRKEDAVLANGMRVTQYVRSGNTANSAASTTNNSATTNKKAELQAKLAAARKSA